MKQGKIIGFNAAKMAEQMMANAVAEQNRRLVEYAKSKIRLIGDAIQLYNSKNHMDRTGNLLDSLCWCVSYKGKVVESGFYRDQIATRLSYLHEWFHNNAEPVGGHILASNFLKQMANLGHSGWRIFFAILAPYWGYWEKGFNFKGKNGTKFLQFKVMSEFYDMASEDLKPAKVTIKSEYPKPYTKESWDKLFEKRDSRSAKKGGFSVYDKYPRGKGKGKYDY